MSEQADATLWLLTTPGGVAFAARALKAKADYEQALEKMQAVFAEPGCSG